MVGVSDSSAKKERGKRGKERKGKQSGGPRDAKTPDVARGVGRAVAAERGAHDDRVADPGAAAGHAVRTRHRTKRVRLRAARISLIPIIHHLPHVA